MHIKENAARVADKLAVAGLSLLASGAALAEGLPVEATAAFTQVGTDSKAMIAQGWPVLVGVVGGMVLMKLFKKVVSKST